MRLLRWALSFGAVAVAVGVGIWARADYKIGPGDPTWRFDLSCYENKAANVFKTNGVVDNATRATFVAGLTAAQQTAAHKAMLDCFIAQP